MYQKILKELREIKGMDWLERLSGTKSAPPPMGVTATAYAPLSEAPGTMSWNRERKNRPGGTLPARFLARSAARTRVPV
jgi:hypothetical protein